MTTTYQIPETYQEIDRALAELRFLPHVAGALHLDRDTAWELINVFRLPAASVEPSVEPFGDSFVVKTPAGYLGQNA